MLGRGTDWRQGDLLTPESAATLGLAVATDGGPRVVVISHDCDLAHDSEAFVEVIVAETVAPGSGPDPNLSYAKNPRRLQLSFDRTDADPLILELRQGEKRPVPAGEFAAKAQRDTALALSAEAKRTLKQWLAARYGRPAFPTSFETRLRRQVRKRSVEQWIGKILEPDARLLVGLFFDLGEQRHAELPDGEPYGLSISVVYDAIEGGGEAREAAERVAGKLREIFSEAFGKPDAATEIALDRCEAVADTFITLADLRRVDQWRLEYISLREDGKGDFLAVGEMPA